MFNAQRGLYPQSSDLNAKGLQAKAPRSKKNVGANKKL